MILDFGDDHLDDLWKHFHTRLNKVCVVSEITSEWTQMQRSLYIRYEKKLFLLKKFDVIPNK